MLTDAEERAIERLGIRYAAAIDARDYAALADCFAANGVWAGPAGERQGGAVIAGYCEGAVGHLDATQHLATNFLVDGEGALATMLSQFVATHLRAGALYTIGGRYRDLLEKIDGDWRFRRRDIVPLWTSGAPEVMRP